MLVKITGHSPTFDISFEDDGDRPITPRDLQLMLRAMKLGYRRYMKAVRVKSLAPAVKVLGVPSQPEAVTKQAVGV